MRTTKIAITIDPILLARLDRLVKQKVFPSRSKAVQEAIQDKLGRLERSRLVVECAKLDPQVEQAFAEEGLSHELDTWPAY